MGGRLTRIIIYGARKMKEVAERYGKLMPQGAVGKAKRGFLIRCLCDCGKTIDVLASNLRSGRTKSCGCSRRCQSGRLLHGMSKTKTYRSWKSMWDRCRNPANVKFQNYGGRGIDVCDEWKDFSRFFGDMGDRPDGATLDRVNSDLGYCAENCRWSTVLQQANNSRTNRIVTANGESHTVTEWARITGLAESAIRYRLRAGWSEEDAVLTPKMRHWRDGRTIPSAGCHTAAGKLAPNEMRTNPECAGACHG